MLRTNHDETSTNTSIGTTDTELSGNLVQTADGALSGKTLGLVDLAEHGVGGLGDEGSCETGDKTGSEVDGGGAARRDGALVNGLVDGLRDLLVYDELGHGVWDPSRIS